MGAPHRPAGRPRRARRGFTLLELMVVVAIIGTLAYMAIPSMRMYLHQANLQQALPYMVEIAQRQIAYRRATGEFYSLSGGVSENQLVTRFDLRLAETGDFCFVFVCRDDAICETPSGMGWAAPAETGDPPIEFEIWGLLRGAATGDISGPNGARCTPAPGKRAPAGWVPANYAPGEITHQGHMVVYRYPPPRNGPDTQAGADGFKFVWQNGFSPTHANYP